MRTYDPAERIVYVHLPSPALRPSAARTDDAVPDRLPTGYANQSPRTRVRRDPGRGIATRHAAAEGAGFESTTGVTP
ncbi:MAG: hypothetical protein ACLGI3_01450 [Actinomycetes bacterium]